MRWTEAQRKEFEVASKHLIEFINKHGNPHMSVIVTPTSAELLSGEMFIKTEKFIKD